MKLYNADCLEQLKKLKPDSIESLVTDPPAGISFMGKEWDHHKGGRNEWIEWMASVMRECYRVMKPGAHGLVWAIPRTSHWTATALEDAGFEVRDVVTHLFGSGFPKSLDISKALDKAAGATREVTGRYEFPDGGNRVKPRTASERVGQLHGHKHTPITAPSTDAAKKWQGFGTALKPAVERWVLVKKPFISPEIDKEICYSNALIGGLLCRLSPAKFAGLVSTSNPSDSMGATSGSAQWLVAALNTLKSIDQSELTAMFKSQAGGSIFLSIALLWSATLEDLLTLESTSTIRTDSGLITALRTLNFSLLNSMAANTLPQKTPQSGSSASASIAVKRLKEIEKLLKEIQTLSAPAIAISKVDSLPPSIKRLQRSEFGLQTAPLSEDFILIRKPCSEKTVAANVLKHGCGALNIDASRIDGGKRHPGNYTDNKSKLLTTGVYAASDRSAFDATQGRFPANLVFSHSPHCTEIQCDIECAIKELDEQSGNRPGFKGQVIKPGTSKFTHQNQSKVKVPTYFAGHADSGGASRFFYCAKISTNERNAGLEGMPDREVRRHGDRAPDVGRQPQKALIEKNSHPTVKPKKLMSYLIRMITPPGGTVLDPFMGSGSTGIAAKECGFKFVGIEKEKEYFEIAQKRIG